MRIAFWHFYTFRLFRGIETLVLSLANALAEHGADVSLITASPTLRPLVQPSPRVHVYAYPTGRYYSHLTIAPFYTAHFLRHRYDSVVTFFADFGESPTWRLLGRQLNLPLALYLCYPYSAVPHRYRSFQKLGWDRSARHILADASWIADEAEELFKRPVSVVPVGTDPVRFSPDPARRAELRAKHGFRDDDVVMLNVSALEPRKGVHRSLQALGRLRRQLPNLRFFILGQGDDEPHLRAMVESDGLGDRVIFGGVTSQLEAYYNMADIFVMLPDAEGNSIAAHEAMSCELPVVVSNSGGFRESVTPEAGFLVPFDDDTAIDSVLRRLVAEPELRHTMGSAGRTHVQQNHSWGRVAEQFLACVAKG
jgi:glycosyltransferase involved in cell wall biosynthesis